MLYDGIPAKERKEHSLMALKGSITGFSLIRNIFYYLTTTNRWTFSNR
jgi:hypothetical protein